MRKLSEKLAERVSEISLGLLEYKDKYSGQRTAAYESTSRSEINGHKLQPHMGHQSQMKKDIKEAETEQVELGRAGTKHEKAKNNRAQSSGEHQP